MDLVHPSNIVGDVLGHVLHLAIEHRPGQRDFAPLDADFDFGRVNVRRHGEPVTNVLADAFVGAFVVLGVADQAFDFADEPTSGVLEPLSQLGLVAGLVQVGEASRADRYTFVASVGIVLWLVCDLASLAMSLFPDRRVRRGVLGGGTV